MNQNDRTELNAALRGLAGNNRITVTPGMTRDDLNAALRNAGPEPDAHEAINRWMRRELGGW